MSFPYKIRKVAWGSCKPNNKSDITTNTTTNNNFDPTLHLGDNINDPHTIGGNLQRAILLDLIELRHRYYTAVSQVATTANNNTNHHATTGISFGQFKKCFREARFGAIHTRTIPARVDRGEYVQLLYSCCFYLLEQAFDTTRQSQEEEDGNASTNYTLNWNDDDQQHNSAFNAIYAIFILYTLHKTNILPKPPPTTLSLASNKYSESLQNSWSMLPIGINNNDEDKLYRRSFHGNVRIDRYNYMLLLRLREICLVRMEQCDISSKKMEFSSSTSAESDTTTTTTTASWECNCSLARDAVYILDSMLSSNDDDNDFFEYCEYHGPHSLEGLSGSSNFYRAYFSNNQKRSNLVDSTTTAAPAHLCNGSEMNDMINNNDDTLDIQSLSQLVKEHQTNLATVMSQLHKSRLTKDDELQPKQRELVENTLKEINIPNDPLQLLATDTRATNDKAKAPPESPTLPETKQESTTKHVSFLQFPETFSTILCNEIRGSLEVDFRTEIDAIRKDVIKNKRKDEVRMNQQVVIDYGDGFTSIGESDPVKRQLGDTSIDGEDSRLDRKRQRQGDNNNEKLELEEVDVLERDDDLSVATGGGRNALYSLLSMVGGNGGGGSDGSNYGEDDSIATAEDKTIMPASNSKSHLPMASNDDDDASVASGMGTRALQFLLSHQSSKKQSKKQPKKKRTKSSQKAPPKEDKNEDEKGSLGEDASDSDNDISVAAGTNALAALLAHV